MSSPSPFLPAISPSHPAAPATAQRRRSLHLGRIAGLFGRARRARPQPLEAMSDSLRADLGLGPAPAFCERRMMIAEHERLQAIMASHFACRTS